MKESMPKFLRKLLNVNSPEFGPVDNVIKAGVNMTQLNSIKELGYAKAPNVQGPSWDQTKKEVVGEECLIQIKMNMSTMIPDTGRLWSKIVSHISDKKGI